jgi:hypothetical protein
MTTVRAEIHSAFEVIYCSRNPLTPAAKLDTVSERPK